MHPTTREDVERFADGDLISPADERRIEHAIERDPQIARWYEEAQAALEPSPAARQAIAAEFQRIARSTYAKLFWQAPLGAVLRHGQGESHEGGRYRLPSEAEWEFACRAGREAAIELPDAERALLKFRMDGSCLTVECDPSPKNWRPASIALFTPCETELALVERPATAPAIAETLPIAFEGVRKLAAETPVELKGKTPPPKIAGAPLSLAARTARPERWNTRPVRSHGGEFWLQDISSVGVAVRCRFPEHAAPEGMRFRLRWEDTDSGRVHDDEKPLVVDQIENGSRRGEAFLRLDLRRFQRLCDDGKLELTVLFPAGPMAAWIDAAGFRDIVGDDFRTLILDTIEGGSRARYHTRFRNDDQRRLWADPAACQMIRFEPL